MKRILILALFLSGCAARHTAAPKEERLWDHCEELIPAKPDGYQHFLCYDVKGRRWEVLVRQKK